MTTKIKNVALSDGMFSAKILADSLSPTVKRLTCMELTFPRMILSEFNTHRMLSKNSGSSRAIPVAVQLRKIIESPFIPLVFGVNEAGMQATKFLEGAPLVQAQEAWLRGRDGAVWSALEMLLGSDELTHAFGVDYGNRSHAFSSETLALKALTLLEEYQVHMKECREAKIVQTRFLNVHKQTANRVLEPYAWHKVIVSATEWDNFWALRESAMAQPEMEKIARLAHIVYDSSAPTLLDYGQNHLPLLDAQELMAAQKDPETWLKVAVGRAARVSAETHDRKGRNIQADIRLYTDLLSEGHMSPFEHIATPARPLEDGTEVWSGNFQGFTQLRKTLLHEDDYSKILAKAAA